MFIQVFVDIHEIVYKFISGKHTGINKITIMATSKKETSPMNETSPKKARKVNSGPIREKGRTMDKMVAAVGQVLQKEGYYGLNIASITKAAGVDRRLVSLYFGNVDNLIAIYLKKNDYWENAGKDDITAMLEQDNDVGQAAITKLLQGQFDTVNNSEILQKLIHWELGENNKTLRELADSREESGQLILDRVEANFPKNGIDLKAVLALQIGGLYYLSLHANVNGSTFCGIDTSKPEGKERISKAMVSLIAMLYEKKK